MRQIINEIFLISVRIEAIKVGKDHEKVTPSHRHEFIAIKLSKVSSRIEKYIRKTPSGH